MECSEPTETETAIDCKSYRIKLGDKEWNNVIIILSANRPQIPFTISITFLNAGNFGASYIAIKIYSFLEIVLRTCSES